MSSTRQTNPDRGVKRGSPGKHARSRSITNEAATAKHTSSGRVKEEEMPGPFITDGAHMPLTHTRIEYEHLQRLLEESYLFREQVIEENQRLLDQLHTTRHELFKLRAFTDFAARKLQQQATRRFHGIDSDSGSGDELEDSKSVDEDM
ncbi:hypothetical protein MVEN_01483000 [Mycena venus]|uniref:Uncharacterized protein n=1 Tax=Mycena venus TaxID=2733690 RepID=A0A8H6XV35_9AGAR|nr:hypothetical protein MVEN_01483000 [Mycena venus]